METETKDTEINFSGVQTLSHGKGALASDFDHAIPFLMVDVSDHCALSLHILSVRPSLWGVNDVPG